MNSETGDALDNEGVAIIKLAALGTAGFLTPKEVVEILTASIETLMHIRDSFIPKNSP